MKKLIVFICFSFSFYAKSQSSIPDNSMQETSLATCDSLKLKIFNKKLKQNLTLMKREYKFDTKQMLVLVKLYNTLSSVDIWNENNKIHNEFSDIFHKIYFGEASNILEGSLIKRGNVYCEKYRLFIGGMYTNCFSKYRIVKKSIK